MQGGGAALGAATSRRLSPRLVSCLRPDVNVRAGAAARARGDAGRPHRGHGQSAPGPQADRLQQELPAAGRVLPGI